MRSHPNLSFPSSLSRPRQLGPSPHARTACRKSPRSTVSSLQSQAIWNERNQLHLDLITVRPCPPFLPAYSTARVVALLLSDPSHSCFAQQHLSEPTLNGHRVLDPGSTPQLSRGTAFTCINNIFSLQTCPQKKPSRPLTITWFSDRPVNNFPTASAVAGYSCELGAVLAPLERIRPVAGT